MSSIRASADAYAAALGLRTVRRYRAEPIAAEDVEAILEAARWTGSSKNLQKWGFIVVEGDQALDDDEPPAGCPDVDVKTGLQFNLDLADLRA